MSTIVADPGSGALPEVLASARALIGPEMAERVWQLPGDQVEHALGELGALRHALDVLEVALAREGVDRGLPAESGYGLRDWLARVEGTDAPSPSSAHIGQVVRVAAAATRTGLLPDPDPLAAPTGGAAEDSGAGRDGAPGDDEPRPAAITDVLDAFTTGSLPLGKTDQIARFTDQVAGLADPGLFAVTLRALLDGAKDDLDPATPSPTGAAYRQRTRGLSERQLRTAIDLAGRLLHPVSTASDFETYPGARDGMRHIAAPAGGHSNANCGIRDGARGPIRCPTARRARLKRAHPAA